MSAYAAAWVGYGAWVLGIIYGAAAAKHGARQAARRAQKDASALRSWEDAAIVVRRKPGGALEPGYIGDRRILESAGYEVRPVTGGRLRKADFPELYEALKDWQTDEETFSLPDLRERAVL